MVEVARPSLWITLDAEIRPDGRPPEGAGALSLPLLLVLSGVSLPGDDDVDVGDAFAALEGRWGRNVDADVTWALELGTIAGEVDAAADEAGPAFALDEGIGFADCKLLGATLG
jgi:hypothetical protein